MNLNMKFVLLISILSWNLLLKEEKNDKKEVKKLTEEEERKNWIKKLRRK